MTLSDWDLKLIRFFRRISVPTARLALFAVFFWFGILKIGGQSPATPLVQHLFDDTVRFCSFDAFIVLFGAYECVIGILFLIRGCERVVIPLLLLHMGATFLPLVLLPSETWTGFMVPTLEGQYIIKNVVIIAAAIGIAAHLQPLLPSHRTRT